MRSADESYFDTLGENFEAFMDDYDVKRRVELIFDDLLLGHALSGRKVLEVGCGTGRISSEIVTRGATLTALDIGENLAGDVAKKLGCTGVVGDACDLPFPDESFDVVISSECIEHTRDPLRAVAEMCRVCRNGGVVCLTTPNKTWFPVLWLSIRLELRKFRGVENWIFPQQARRAMKQAGFRDIGVSGCHLWPFQLKQSRFALERIDRIAGRRLYPFMINFGIRGTKRQPA